MATRNGLEPSTSSVTGWRANRLHHRAKLNGGNNRARTCDPMLVRHVLSQLSYAPFVSLLRCSPQRRGSLYTLAPVLSTPFFRKNPSFFRRTFCVPKLSVRLTCFPENVILGIYGELSERFKEPVLKTGDGETHREFESHTLRQKETTMLARELSFLFVLFSFLSSLFSRIAVSR